MKKKLLVLTLFTSLLGFSQELIEDCSPINGNIQMAWYPMNQYTDPNSPGFIYTEGTTQGDPNIAIFGFQIPSVINYNSIVTISENFEIASEISEGFSQSIVKEMGSSRNFYIRLKYGLPAGDYSGVLTTTTSYFPNNVCTQTVYGRVLPATASIKDDNISGLKIYPNPAVHTVDVISNLVGNKNITIMDILGKQVLHTITEQTVNVSNLKSGVYLMKITQEGKTSSRKLVIK